MKTAMIFAAGRGERLRPLTEFIPKALCKLNNIPLIEHHVVNLAKNGYQRIVINHAYLGGKIRQHLQNGQRFGVEIIYSPEPPGAFETGGGILNALSFLGNEPFLTVNADIYTDYNFASMLTPSEGKAHLILVKKPDYSTAGDFDLSATNQLKNTNKKYTFAGIACYHPSLFKDCKPGRYSLTPMIRKLAETNQITGEIYHGIWFDIGTLERLQIAEKALIQAKYLLPE